jgi:hypothetical protein
MTEEVMRAAKSRRSFPIHGLVGLGLIIVFWAVNWFSDGLRTHWAFFPLWLGYCLTVDGLVFSRKGTSLLTRDWRKYLGLFLLSSLVWWIFEAINYRLQNWHYDGGEYFSQFGFAFWATLSFTTVIPAVFGTAELLSSFNFIKQEIRGPVIKPTRKTTITFFSLGITMFVAMMVWPKVFFPFVWLSIFFVIEPVNVWLGNRSLTEWIRHGDWRPVASLWLGVLITGFFWEMWNFFSYPKWIYHVPWGNCCHIFEMPLLGYGGYLPFALELFAMYHLLAGLLGDKQTQYVQVTAVKDD